jgi:hypothetical protein
MSVMIGEIAQSEKRFARLIARIVVKESPSKKKLATALDKGEIHGQQSCIGPLYFFFYK